MSETLRPPTKMLLDASQTESGKSLKMSFNEHLKQFRYTHDATGNGSRRSPRLQAAAQSDETDPGPSSASNGCTSTSSTSQKSDRALPLKRARATNIKAEDEENPVGSLSPVKRERGSGADSNTNVANSSRSSNSQRRLTASPRRPSSKYVAPSRYAHLSPLVDVLEPGLLLVFVGVNPGISTATTGHAYAHPSNRFWHLLHVSGLTGRKLSPTEDRDLPRLYRYGNTNIVSRPTKDQGELSKEEMVAGTADLEEKFRHFKPEVVCIVGKGIWEAIWRYKYGRAIKKEEFSYGWQDERHNMGAETVKTEDSAGQSSSDVGNIKEEEDVGASSTDVAWRGSRVFVATSTSGQAASMRPAEREAIWKVLGDWMTARRQQVDAQ